MCNMLVAVVMKCSRYDWSATCPGISPVAIKSRMDSIYSNGMATAQPQYLFLWAA